MKKFVISYIDKKSEVAFDQITVEASDAKEARMMGEINKPLVCLLVCPMNQTKMTVKAVK